MTFDLSSPKKTEMQLHAQGEIFSPNQKFLRASMLDMGPKGTDRHRETDSNIL